MTNGALIVAVPPSIGAAASFAVANVAQMCAARHPATTRTLDPRLLVRLGAEPLWLAGLAASIVGFALETGRGVPEQHRTAPPGCFALP
jgi:hypothetical protein